MYLARSGPANQRRPGASAGGSGAIALQARVALAPVFGPFETARLARGLGLLPLGRAFALALAGGHLVDARLALGGALLLARAAALRRLPEGGRGLRQRDRALVAHRRALGQCGRREGEREERRAGDQPFHHGGPLFSYGLLSGAPRAPGCIRA